MLDRLTTGISDANPGVIDWVKSRQDIVDGVEVVFSAVKARDDAEGDTIEKMFDVLKDGVELAGVEGLPVDIIAAGVLAPFLAIGAGYADAADEIKRNTASLGFCEGVVLGVVGERTDFIRDQFWELNLPSPPRNVAFEQGDLIEQYYNNAGLVLGYDYGRDLQSQSQTFYTDLRRSSDSVASDPGSSPSDQQMRDFYISLAGAFYKLHIQDS
jgi:hypothetical protein